MFDLDAAIRRIPDFPKAGVLFYDITSILTNPDAFAYCINRMTERYRSLEVDSVIAVESRGFVFAAPFALSLNIPLVLARKRGKLPGETYSRTYALEYGSDTIEIHKSDLSAGQNVIIVDDLVATGGTLKATAEIVSEVGARTLEVFSVIGLPFLGFRDHLAPLHVETLIEFDSE